MSYAKGRLSVSKVRYFMIHRWPWTLFWFVVGVLIGEML